MLCSSGRVGVGYERGTCSFTCNAGYELTGGDTRTCQSNGSWSGEDAVCRRGIVKQKLWLTNYVHSNKSLVNCLPLFHPSNGMINCSLGGDDIYSFDDTCSFTCNTGYELTGSDTRSCQSDGSWSGTFTLCIKSM